MEPRGGSIEGGSSGTHEWSEVPAQTVTRRGLRLPKSAQCSKFQGLGFTWTLKVFKIMAIMVMIIGLGLSFTYFWGLGFRGV